MSEIQFAGHMRKFHQAVGDQTWKTLVRLAKQRDTSVQELIRNIILPEWLKAQGEKI